MDVHYYTLIISTGSHEYILLLSLLMLKFSQDFYNIQTSSCLIKPLPRNTSNSVAAPACAIKSKEDVSLALSCWLSEKYISEI